MNFIMELYAYLVANGVALVAIVTTALALAEMVVRITPTKKDDGAVERIGKVVRKILDFVSVPNRKEGGGNFMPKSDDK